MIIGKEGRRRQISKARKLESVKLADDASKLEQKLAEMKEFVKNEKIKDEKWKRSQQANSNSKIAIGGVEERMKIAQQRAKTMFKKKGLWALDEAIKKKLQKKKEGGDQSSELRDILDGLGLAIIEDELKDAGIQTKGQLLSADIAQIGLKPGHEIKLKKYILSKRKIKSKNIAVSEDQVYKEDPQPSGFRPKSGKYSEIIEKNKRALKSTKVASKPLHAKAIPKHPKQINTNCSSSTDAPIDLSPKSTCWVCCAGLSEDSKVCHPILDKKEFCSVTCLRNEFATVSSNCSVCGKILIKENSLIKGIEWFCGDNCFSKWEITFKSDSEEVEDIDLGFESGEED